MMRERNKHPSCWGQSTLEFVWLMITVISIILALQTILKRAVGGRYRSSIDQLSQSHFDPKETYNMTVRSTGTRRDTVSDGTFLDAQGKPVPQGVSRSEVQADPNGKVDASGNPAGELSTQTTNIGSQSELDATTFVKN